MQSRKLSKFSCRDELSHMFYLLRRKLNRFCSRLRWFVLRRSRPKLVIKRLTKSSNPKSDRSPKSGLSFGHNTSSSPIRIATFNAALFSLAPAVPKAEKSLVFIPKEDESLFAKINSNDNRSKPTEGILKQSENHSKQTRSRPKVSINLPENEISLAQNKLVAIVDDPSSQAFTFNTNSLLRSPIYFPPSTGNNSYWWSEASLCCKSRTIFDVLKEVDADIFALQDVKAEEEKEMKPLSDLARALGMNYVFAESWAPEYGNAVLSKWPIKRFKVQKIYDDQDFRNVIKATIDVPWTGELDVYCTQLDHLDENWRMKQIDAMIDQSNDQPHVLLGGLNSLDASDYSSERWNDIIKYYEELGKPTPRVEVTNFLKESQYTDAKHFPGECEPVVMIAKGQNVQGTCKYGTRVDYILSSKGLPYTFIPGSYSVFSSKGTSDHHIVKVDMQRVAQRRETGKKKRLRQRIVRLSHSCSSRGIWEINSS